VNQSWGVLLLGIGLVYLLLNAVFASAYLAGGDCIANARAGSFSDAYNFSIQTMAGIGYGAMTPKTPYANVLVAVESMVSLLGLAVATGIIFAKFARPTSKVLFSDVAVVSQRDGKPTLMFRASNQRSNFIVHPRVTMSLFTTEKTVEGETIRRIIDLQLVRDTTPFFALTWTVSHVIDESSPLYGSTIKDLEAHKSSVVISLMGHDSSYGQSVHAQQVYPTSQILYGRRFADVLSAGSNGEITVDLKRFHDTIEWPLDYGMMGCPDAADQSVD